MLNKHTEEAVVAGRIHKLRVSLLAFRYLYYCQQWPIITDFEYDTREFELRALVDAYPSLARMDEYDEFCPTKTVGSDNVVDYPDEIMDLAEQLAFTHANLAGAAPPYHSTEELSAALDCIVDQLTEEQQRLF